MDRPARPRRRLGGVPRRRRPRVRRRRARGHGGAGARAAQGRPQRSAPTTARCSSGIATAYSFQVTVPGGAAVPAAGVSWVGVLPTHRRRGVLRALMTHQLHAVHDAGRRAAGHPLGVRAGDLRPVRLRPGAAGPTASTCPAARPRCRPARPTTPDCGCGWSTPPTGRPSCRSTTRWRPPGRAWSLREEPWWQRAVRDLASMRGARRPSGPWSPRTATGCAASRSTGPSSTGTSASARATSRCRRPWRPTPRRWPRSTATCSTST